MNFNFGTEKPLTAEAVENSRMQALVAANDLQVAYENLTDAQKSISGSNN